MRISILLLAMLASSQCSQSQLPKAAFQPLKTFIVDCAHSYKIHDGPDVSVSSSDTYNPPLFSKSSKSTHKEIRKGKEITQIDFYNGYQDQDFYFSVATNSQGNVVGGIAAQRGIRHVDGHYSIYSFAIHRSSACQQYPTFESLFAKSGPTQESVNGIVLNRYSTNNDYGKMSIWLDPAHQNRVVKYSILTEAHHLVSAKDKLRDTIVKTVNGKDIITDKQDVIYNVTKYGSGEFSTMPFAYTIETNLWYSDATTFTSKESVEIKKLTRLPEGSSVDLSPKIKIPNGTRVTVAGEESIEHEWRDGKIVKKVSSKAVEQVTQVEFKKPESSGVRWLWVAGPVVGMLAILGFVWWRKRGKA
jgi:hypothetical protein